MQSSLLAWFDTHRRVMPWRAAAGKRADPYHVWLSEIMLQQTTVATVGAYFEKFVRRWPTIRDLARAETDDVLAAWAGLGYYARARNLHKCARAVVDEHNGIFPRSEEALKTLPGIGPYTAAAIASIAFDVPAVAVDGNVERVTSRVFKITQPLPNSKPDIKAGAARLAAGVERAGDFTQAFMELGATVCAPRKPKCGICPWGDFCKGRLVAETLPRKKEKRPNPVRYGNVFWIEKGEGARRRFMIERRTGAGLYQSMYQLPTTAWVEDAAGIDDFPQQRLFVSTGATVRHSFTHFDLVLTVWRLKKTLSATAEKSLMRDKTLERQWIADRDREKFAIPTLMKKVILLSMKADKPARNG